MRRCSEQFVHVAGLETRRQHTNGAQVQAPVGNRLEQHRESATDFRRLNALPRRVFGEVQLAHAVAKHRVVAERPVILLRVDLRELGQPDRDSLTVL
jgi:hypothetical protein